MKMVMEKSRNMKNRQKVMEFCDQSWNFTSFAPEFYPICTCFAISFEVCIFLPFPKNVANAKFKQRDGHGNVIEKSGWGGGGGIELSSRGNPFFFYIYISFIYPEQTLEHVSSLC